MNLSNDFIELSADDEFLISGGSTTGNVLICAGGIIACCASGPVGVGVGIAIAVLGFIDSQGW